MIRPTLVLYLSPFAKRTNQTFTERDLAKMETSAAMATSPNIGNNTVTLQVGEKRFITTEKSLKGSHFFSTLLDRWTGNKQEDGSYFIDADLDVFTHILRYLRHEVLPVFYDPLKEHEFPLYTAVLQQAQYFQVPQLETWLSEKRYLQAVQVEHSAVILTGKEEISGTKPSDTTVEYHPMWTTRNVYVCSRAIFIHRGN